jgi:predicted PhzF superfamily epimerase YddE/YHI9
MDFPAIFSAPAQLPASVLDAVGTDSSRTVCHRARGAENGNYLLELDSEAAVRHLQPGFEPLGQSLKTGLIVTARADSSDYDFVSRFFAPFAGVDEDPVTGSAHCQLATYWAERIGKTVMVGYQASARGGEVRVQLNGDRVGLGGSAVTILRGTLCC